jgi:hypothetical protein
MDLILLFIPSTAPLETRCLVHAAPLSAEPTTQEPVSVTSFAFRPGVRRPLLQSLHQRFEPDRLSCTGEAFNLRHLHRTTAVVGYRLPSRAA